MAAACLPAVSSGGSESTSDHILIVKVKRADLAGQLGWGSVRGPSCGSGSGPTRLPGERSGLATVAQVPRECRMLSLGLPRAEELLSAGVYQDIECP